MPLNLLIMQKRIYNQGWGVTVLRHRAPDTFCLDRIGLAVCMVGIAAAARL